MRTNVNVRGLIIKEEKVLLIHRFKNGAEYWVVPGGGVEEGETKEEGLQREMREETGLEIIDFKLLTSIDTPQGEQYLYRGELDEGELKIGGPEAEDENENNKYILTWVPIEQAKRLEKLYPEVVKDYLK